MLEFNVAIPIWLLAAVGGLPMLFLTGWVFHFIRMKRGRTSREMERKPEDVLFGPEAFGIQVCEQLLEQNIDGVFTELSSVLETERIKLKTLLKYSWPAAPAESDLMVTPEQNKAHVDTNTAEVAIGPCISLMSAQCLAPETVDNPRGRLSRSKVGLAVKMKVGRSAGRNMQALA